MRRLIGRVLAIPVFVIIVSLMLNAILAVLLALTYSSLTEEKVIATITFDAVDNQKDVYIAHLYKPDGFKMGDYKIYGDQWRMDAGFIKMEYWANVFGVDSRYILNRFEGRYNDIEKQNVHKHQAYQLESDALINTFSFLVDTTYGSSVYKEIKTDTVYTVLKTQTGLMVRMKQIAPTSERGLLDTVMSWIG